MWRKDTSGSASSKGCEAVYRIDIMTLFPDTVGDVLSESILGRAQERDLLRIETHQIRDYTLNRQKQVDDYPYGGGRGAVLQADPLYRCWKHITETFGPGRTIYLSPCGRTFDQAAAKRLAREYDHLILVCGHYEGIDQRFIDAYVDEEISLGDFVLTGGEIAAMAVSDAVCRQVPGVLSDSSCFENESHWDGLLEYPQYSRPEVWQGRAVPRELLTGNHSQVERWRRKEQLRRTRQRRPDLFGRLDLSSREDQALLKELDWEASRIPLTHPLSVRPACPEDLPALLDIAAQAQARLRRNGVDQWQDAGGYPGPSDFQADMARGECHVICHDGEIAAFFTLSAEHESGYDAITDGKWSCDEPYTVLHRCAVADRFQGLGVADRIISECKAFTLAMGRRWLRADTHKKNKTMQNLLRRSGFQYRGNVLVHTDPGHDPRRLAFEVRLSGKPHTGEERT